MCHSVALFSSKRVKSAVRSVGGITLHRLLSLKKKINRVFVIKTYEKHIFFPDDLTAIFTG